MTGIPLRRDKRAAFTLVELMVVVLIIAILVSLVSSAVFKAMEKIPETRTRTEIGEMETALRIMMMDFGLADPPPSFLILNEASPTTPSPVDSGRSAAFLSKMFGKSLGPTDWNGDGSTTGQWTLQGEQCLIFYLGGIPNSAAVLGGSPPAPQGFSTSKINPAQAGGKRKGPYFPFQTSRFYPQQPGSPYGPPAGWNGFFVYIDPWETKTGPNYATMGGSPYTFFSSQGINNAYSATSSYSAAPYFTAPGQFTNPNTYQIISSGKNGVFGGGLWNPSSGATGAGVDDQSNFSAGLLGKGQQ